MKGPQPTVRLVLAATARCVLADGRELQLEVKDALLLAWLALEGPTPRARLASLLWPEAEGDRSRAALRQRLARLKRATGVSLLTAGETAALAPHVRCEGIDSDLLTAVTVDVGTELCTWLATRRSSIRQARVERLSASAAQAESAGELAAALSDASALIELEPTSEHAHRRLMRLHYLRGDPAAALAAYARCRELLARELNVEPSTETATLRQQIEAQQVDASRFRAVPVTVLRPPRLIGRAVEWERLGQVWAACAAAIVIGEPGLGKSRLLSDVLSARGNGVMVAGRPGDDLVPYALLSRLVRAVIARVGMVVSACLRSELARLLPELGEAEPMTIDAHRARFVNAVDALFASLTAHDVGGVAVDDLQFGDEASVEMLHHLIAQKLPLAWLVAYRPAELSRSAVALTDAMARSMGAAQLRLAPFSECDIGELIESLGVEELRHIELAPKIARHTGGNPLFVLETLKAMITLAPGASETLVRSTGARLPLPASVAALIEQRIRQLSPGAIKLARCAALAGQDFSASIAAEALNTSPLDLADAWTELQDAQVLRDDAFAHDLICEAVLVSVPAAIARSMHEALGHILLARGALPARAAEHLDAAGRHADAAPLWVKAGDSAAAALRFAEAASAYERAVELFHCSALDSEGFSAALKLRKVCHEVDLRDRSERALQLLDLLARTDVQHACAENERAFTCLMRGDLAGTERHAQAGLRFLRGADQPLLRAELRRSLAAVLTWKGEVALALNELRSIQGDIERLGTPAQRFDLLQSLSIVLDHNDEGDEAVERHHEAIELALSLGNLAGAAQSALNLVVSLHDMGALEAAAEALARAKALLDALPEAQRSYSSFALNSGLVERGLGHYALALLHHERAIELAREQTPGWLPLVIAHYAQTLLDLGQVARAHQVLDAHAPDPSTPPLAVARWRAVRTAVDLLLGKAIGNELDPLIDAQSERGRQLTRWRLQIVRLALHGDTQAKLAEAESILPAVAAAGRHGVAVSVHTRAAQLATRLGVADVAVDHARSAGALLRRWYPDNLYIGEVWLAAYHALRLSVPAEAADVLEAGIGWLRQTASQHVPPEFLDSFLHRNPVNRALLTLSTRRRLLDRRSDPRTD